MPYLLPLFVLMLRMTGALGLRIRRRILRLRILRVRRGICRRRLARCGRHDHARAVVQTVCAPVFGFPLLVHRWHTMPVVWR